MMGSICFVAVVVHSFLTAFLLVELSQMMDTSVTGSLRKLGAGECQKHPDMVISRIGNVIAAYRVDCFIISLSNVVFTLFSSRLRGEK